MSDTLVCKLTDSHNVTDKIDGGQTLRIYNRVSVLYFLFHNIYEYFNAIHAKFGNFPLNMRVKIKSRYEKRH